MDNYLSEYISLVGGQKKMSKQPRRKTSSHNQKRAEVQYAVRTIFYWYLQRFKI